MKKKILKASFVAAFAMIAGYGVYNSQKDVVLSDIALANVEALAGGESGEGFGTVSKDEYSHTLHCSGTGSLPCQWR